MSVSQLHTRCRQDVSSTRTYHRGETNNLYETHFESIKRVHSMCEVLTKRVACARACVWAVKRNKLCAYLRSWWPLLTAACLSTDYNLSESQAEPDSAQSNMQKKKRRTNYLVWDPDIQLTFFPLRPITFNDTHKFRTVCRSFPDCILV